MYCVLCNHKISWLRGRKLDILDKAARAMLLCSRESCFDICVKEVAWFLADSGYPVFGVPSFQGARRCSILNALIEKRAIQKTMETASQGRAERSSRFKCVLCFAVRCSCQNAQGQTSLGSLS